MTTIEEGQPEPPHNTIWTSEDIVDCQGTLLHWDRHRNGWTWGAENFAYPWDHMWVQRLLPVNQVTPQ